MILQEWYNQGCISGDTSKLEKAIHFSQTKKELGTPDLVLKMKDKFIIPGDNKDRFMVTKLPFELDSKAFSIKSMPLTPSSIGGNSTFSNGIFLIALAAPL